MRSWYPFSPGVDAASLPEAAAHAPILVVHVWAEWNGDDRRADAQLRRLSEEFAGQIEFRSLYVDDEENRPLLSELKVMAVPTLLLFTRSGPPRLLVGPRSPRELRRLFTSLVDDWAALRERRAS